MAINFSITNYLPCQDLFGRPITVDPVGSQLGGSPYQARGIYDSRTLNVPMEDGSILSDQDTILDIRDAEFPILPRQDDIITIDYEPVALLPRLGVFVVTNVWNNGGGETTLQLRKVAP
jgi:hypothetical protein